MYYKKIITPILLTGTKGFIGSNILRYLIKHQFKNIHIIIRNKENLWRINDLLKSCNVHIADLNNTSRVNTLIKKIKPKTIFHLAAYGAYSYQSDFDKIKNNIFISTVNLLNACMKYNFKIFINTGSNSEYGFKSQKMNENDILEPNSFYSIFKASSTHYCNYLAAEKKLNILTLRPFHVYGPYEERTRLIPTLIDNLINKKRTKMVNPKISRDLIYIEDVVDIYLQLACKKKINGVINVASGKNRNMKEIYNSVAKIIDSKIMPKWGKMKSRDWDQKIWLADVKKLNFMCNPKKTSFSSGLKKTFNWHKNFYYDN